MADQLLLPPAEDANGDRVSAAVAYFYQTGTTTPVTVYEEDGTTPLGTSVVAGSSGVFPQVFTTSGTAIKIDVKTPLGASLPGYPVDPAIRVPTENSQAAGVSFAPSLDRPEVTVQAAIDGETGDRIAAIAAEATAREQGRGYTFLAAQNTTSGTFFDFTGIPAWATEIVVLFFNVSLSGTDHIAVQLGTSGGVVTSGYVSSSSAITSGSGSSVNSTTAFIVHVGSASDGVLGAMTINGLSSTLWVESHSVHCTALKTANGGGGITLAGQPDRVRVTRTGSNTFDLGAVRVGYR